MIYLAVRGGAASPIDARPSDAIALSLRTRHPIFVEAPVHRAGESVDFAPRRRTPSPQEWLENLDPATSRQDVG